MNTSKGQDEGRYVPAVEDQRRHLTEQRDHFRMQGYRAEIDIEIIRAQPVRDGKIAIPLPNGGMTQVDEKQHLTNLQKKSRNAYAVARRLQEKIDELPADEDGDDGSERREYPD